MLRDQVKREILRRTLMPAGSRGLVAFSGGADSLCLLTVLRELADELAISFSAAHVDHGLRATSATDAQAAVELARHAGVATVVLTTCVTPGGNVQERAREARLSLLEEQARRVGATWIASAHTANDQAETLLMRLCRGTGLDGLTGIPWRRGPWVRPLLNSERRDVEQYLEQRGLRPIDDPTNAERRYLRNRLRQDAVSALVNENESAIKCLTTSLENLHEDSQALDSWAAEAWAKLGTRLPSGVHIDVAALLTYPAAIQHRVIRLGYAHCCGTTRGLTRGHVEAVLGLCSAAGGAQTHLPRVLVEFRAGRLSFHFWAGPGRPQRHLPLPQRNSRLGTTYDTISTLGGGTK